MKGTLIKWASITLVIALLAGLGFWGGMAVNKSRAAPSLEAQAIATSFLQQNPGMTIQQQGTQTKVFVVAWKDKENEGVSVLLGGVWTKIYSQPLAKTETPAPTPTVTP